MGLTIERIYPYLAGAIAFAVWWYFHPVFPKNPEQVLSSSLTIGAILTGFLATSKAILMGLRGTPVWESLHSSGYITDLVSYLAQAIWVSFAYCLVGLIGFFVDPQSIWFASTWFAVGVTAGFAFIRVTNIFLKILEHNR